MKSMHERRFDPSRAHLLDSPDRQRFLPQDAVIAALHPREGDKVADIGAGTGYFALPIAAVVGARGQVLAVDVSPQMLEMLKSKLVSAGLENVRSVEGAASATGLPSGNADLVLLANVWHEFDDHLAVLEEARRLLKPGGRIAVLDWRPDVTPEPGPPLPHRIALGTARNSVESAGFSVSFADDIGEYSWLLIGAIKHD